MRIGDSSRSEEAHLDDVLVGHPRRFLAFLMLNGETDQISQWRWRVELDAHKAAELAKTELVEELLADEAAVGQRRARTSADRTSSRERGVVDEKELLMMLQHGERPL